MMNQKLSSIAIALTCIALLSVGYTQLQGQAAANTPPTATATVDVRALLQGLDEQAAIKADLNVMTEKVQREDQERKAELTALQEDLKISKKGTDNFNKLMEKLEIKAMEYEAWGKLQQLRVAREEVLRTKRIYRKMVDAIADIAKIRKIDIVLHKDGVDNIDTLRVQNQQQLLSVIGGHKVLYATDAVDITTAVTQKMNNDFNVANKK